MGVVFFFSVEVFISVSVCFVGCLVVGGVRKVLGF